MRFVKLRVEYGNWYRALGEFVSPLFTIVAVVAGLAFLDYFSSKAQIRHDVQYHNRYYNLDSIAVDLVKYAPTLSRLPVPWPSQQTKMSQTKADYFKSKLFSEQALVSYRGNNYFAECENALRYEYRDSVGNYLGDLAGTVNNTAFWEGVFPDSLYKIVDSATYLQVLNIVISRREVTVLFALTNVGNADARNVTVYLQAPFLVSFRHVMLMVAPEFIRIDPMGTVPIISIHGPRAEIQLPFLKKKQTELFQITTTLSGITNLNVHVNYETERAFEFSRFLIVVCVVALVYLSIPLICALMTTKRKRSQ